MRHNSHSDFWLMPRDNKNIDVTVGSHDASYAQVLSRESKSKDVYHNVVYSRKWDKELLSLANKYLLEDVPIEEDAPGGRVHFRRALVQSLFLKFFDMVQSSIGKVNLEDDKYDCDNG